MFLQVEARRYRYFDVWRFRARILEIAFYVPLLRGEGAKISQDRGNALSDDYLRPQFHVSYLRAVGRRLRRNYGWIFAIQIVAYLGKLTIHPDELLTWTQFLERAAIGPIPGEFALLAGIVFHGGWAFIAVLTWWMERRDTSITHDALHTDN